MRRHPFRPGSQETLCGGAPFRDLVDLHWDSVYRLLFRMTANPHDTEDLAQETFLRALRRRESFRAGTNARAWLLRIASNAFLDLCRRNKAARTQALDPVELDGHSDGKGGIAQIDEPQGRLAAAIAALPDIERLVFLLRVQEEQSYREIAEALDMPETTARWRMRQARRQLRERLKVRL